MICLECKALDLQKYPAHSKAGIGKCTHEQMAGAFVSLGFKRECSNFVAADPATVEKRLDWYRGKK